MISVSHGAGEVQNPTPLYSVGWLRNEAKKLYTGQHVRPRIHVLTGPGPATSISRRVKAIIVAVYPCLATVKVENAKPGQEYKEVALFDLLTDKEALRPW